LFYKAQSLHEAEQAFQLKYSTWAAKILSPFKSMMKDGVMLIGSSSKPKASHSILTTYPQKYVFSFPPMLNQ
jgi:hypothetical protein